MKDLELTIKILIKNFHEVLAYYRTSILRLFDSFLNILF